MEFAEDVVSTVWNKQVDLNIKRPITVKASCKDPLKNSLFHNTQLSNRRPHNETSYLKSYRETDNHLLDHFKTNMPYG